MENKLVVNIDSAGYSDFQLRNINFTLEPGNILVVTGRSGSGKSTLLYSLTGLIKLRGGFVNGCVKYKDIDLLKQDLISVFKKVFIIPQEPWYSIVGYSVYTEYCHTLSVYGYECRLDGLEKTNMVKHIDRLTYTLSAGEYQRLILSEVFATKPEVILLDEPLTYVDLDTRPRIVKYVEELVGEKHLVIVVDHISSNWSSLDPKLMVLNNGRVEYFGKYTEYDEQYGELRRISRRTSGGNFVLRARNIWFKYPGQKPVLRGVSIDLRFGELTGLRGSNGVGKTTFLKILAGLLKPFRGFVERKGSTIYVPENPLLYLTHPTPRLELGENTAGDILVSEVVDVFNLRNILDKPLKYLSTGERRRLALASAFIRNYDVYLLDEPTGGLDHYSLETIIHILEYLVEKKKAILIAHHDPRLSKLFDREYLLVNGEVVEYS